MAGGSVGFYVGISILVLKNFPPKAVTLSEKYYHWKSMRNDSNRWRALTIDFLFVVRTPPLGRLLFIQAESSCFGMWVGEGCLTVLPMK